MIDKDLEIFSGFFYVFFLLDISSKQCGSVCIGSISLSMIGWILLILIFLFRRDEISKFIHYVIRLEEGKSITFLSRESEIELHQSESHSESNIPYSSPRQSSLAHPNQETVNPMRPKSSEIIDNITLNANGK